MAANIPKTTSSNKTYSSLSSSNEGLNSGRAATSNPYS